MKLRRKVNLDSPRAQARKLLKTIVRAEATAPLAEMEPLIALAKADAAIGFEVVEAAEDVLAKDPPNLAPCWLVLVMGELPLADGAWPLLFGLTASEGDAVDEALVPVLTRRATELLAVVSRIGS